MVLKGQINHYHPYQPHHHHHHHHHHAHYQEHPHQDHQDHHLLPLLSDHFESWELTSQGGDNAELGRPEEKKDLICVFPICVFTYLSAMPIPSKKRVTCPPESAGHLYQSSRQSQDLRQTRWLSLFHRPWRKNIVSSGC